MIFYKYIHYNRQIMIINRWFHVISQVISTCTLSLSLSLCLCLSLSLSCLDSVFLLQVVTIAHKNIREIWSVVNIFNLNTGACHEISYPYIKKKLKVVIFLYRGKIFRDKLPWSGDLNNYAPAWKHAWSKPPSIYLVSVISPSIGACHQQSPVLSTILKRREHKIAGDRNRQSNQPKEYT